MLSIIIPVKNEEENVLKLIKEIETSLKDIVFELIFVSDSTDNTDKIINNIHKKNIYLFNPKKNDLAQSVAYGIKKSNYDIICVMDGDQSHPPSLIPKMFKHITSYDIVVATRKKKSIQKWPAHRKIFSHIAQTLAYPLLPISDNMSGFFMVKKETIQNMRMRTRGYKILLEIATKKRVRIKDIPYDFKLRTHGTSHMDCKIMLLFLLQLPYLYVYKLKTIMRI